MIGVHPDACCDPAVLDAYAHENAGLEELVGLDIMRQWYPSIR